MDEHFQHKRKTEICSLNAYVENRVRFIRIHLNASRNMVREITEQ